MTSPDPSFGLKGLVLRQVVPGEANAATSVALEPGGDVLIGGSAGPGQAALGGSPDGFVTRLLPTGRIDSSFGGSGSVRPAGLAAVEQVEPAHNGDVLALGGSLMLLEHSGKTVAAFGVNGSAPMPDAFVPRRFALEQDGSIALVGTVAQGGGEPAVVRLTAGGRLDPAFGSDGLVVLPPPRDELGHQLRSVTPGGLVVQPNGDIVLTLRGVTRATPTFESPESVLERVTSKGALDASFGPNGQAVIGRTGEEVGAFDPVLGAGGDILVGIDVSSGTGAHSFLAVWRVSADGLALAEEPDLEVLPLRDPVGDFVALPDGFGLLLRGEGSYLKASSVYIGADNTEPPNPLPDEEALMLPDGAIDHDGLVAVQADGKLVLAGSAPLTNGEQGIFVERLGGVSVPAIVNLHTQAVHRGLRSVTLRLSCSRARSCRGLAVLSSSGNPAVRYAGSRMFTIAPGHSRNVILGFSRVGRRRFSKRAKTHVTLTVILDDGPERAASITLPARR